jgi:gluconate 2-dehydrogenase
MLRAAGLITGADLLMGLVLTVARRVVELAERVRAGEWDKSVGRNWFGIDVHHWHSTRISD